VVATVTVPTVGTDARLFDQRQCQRRGTMVADRSPAGGITGGVAYRSPAGGITGGVDGDGSQRVNLGSTGNSPVIHRWNFYPVKKPTLVYNNRLCCIALLHSQI